MKIRNNIISRDIKGLLIFGQDYDMKLNVICNIDVKRIEVFGTQNITIWPVKDFLEDLWANKIF